MKKIVFALVILFAATSHAEIMLEPYAGYISGSYDNGSGGTKGDLSGMGFGARVGYAFPLIFVAGDYLMGSPKVKDKTSGISDSGSVTAYGLDVGVYTPMGLRGWLGYSISDKLKDKDQNSTLEGSSFKVGIGYKWMMLPISVNLEYIMSTYNKQDGTTLSDKYNAKTFFVSLSFPFLLM